jgi:magnesium transporter
MIQTSAPAGALYRTADGELRLLEGADEIAAALRDGRGLLWLDLFVRSPGDGALLEQVFRFHPLAVEDSTSPRVDPAKIDDYGDYIFIVVQALTGYVPGRELEAVEVDFFFGKNYVVSTHRDPVPAIETLKQRISRDERLMNRGPDWLLHSILDAMVDEYLPIVDAVDEAIDRAEEEILQSPRTAHLQDIMLVRRNALRLRRATTPMREIMNRLSRHEFPQFISPEAATYYRDIYDHLVRVEYLVEAVRDLADGALNTYLSVVSNRLNEVMKVLTAAATVFLPLTLISGIYGMNFARNQFPPFESSWGFPAVVAGMVVLAFGLLAYFRHRGWV